MHADCSLLTEQEKRSYRVSLCNRKEVKAMWQCGSVAQISIAHNSDTHPPGIYIDIDITFIYIQEVVADKRRGPFNLSLTESSGRSCICESILSAT